MKKLADSQKGYIISLVMFFMMVIMLSIALTMTFLVINRQKSIANTLKSTQAYYASESGIEDALVRLKKTPQMSSLTYNLIVNNVTAYVNVPNVVGGSRSIASQASNYGMTRKIQVAYSIDSTSTSFYYGAQAGAGGLVMNNGSRIMGNIFSGGNISGSGTIDNDAIVSGNGNSISGVTVKGNAQAYGCLSGATINGSLTYVTGGQHTCSHGSLTEQSAEILAQPLPIPESQINDWKIEASTACNSADVSRLNTNYTTVSMGPCKVNGDLNFKNGNTLTLTGTVYVTGNINFGQHNTVNLSSSYGIFGGTLIADGIINTGTNNTFSGSPGQSKSYLLILSTNTSDSAIIVTNGSNGAVFYTSVGGLTILNGVSVIEATGYKVIMDQNSTIQYSAGIVNIYFSSGPGGGWKVTNWQEY